MSISDIFSVRIKYSINKKSINAAHLIDRSLPMLYLGLRSICQVEIVSIAQCPYRYQS